jgi:hypothetical protein
MLPSESDLVFNEKDFDIVFERCNRAFKERDAAEVQRFQNFLFHCLSAQNTLPNFSRAAAIIATTMQATNLQ